ncbi:MAG: DUF3429 domain-containing protein [Woeseiaceae bacterium]|jgi:hypothetical protein
MDRQTVYSALMLLGLVPFLACAFLPVLGVEEVARLGRLDELASSYSVAILCFLTGIHWATQLYAEDSAPPNLFIVSNVVFLIVWIAYAASELQWALGTQLLAYPLLLAVDFQLFGKGLISQNYLRMRVVATALACFSLLFILVS